MNYFYLFLFRSIVCLDNLRNLFDGLHLSSHFHSCHCWSYQLCLCLEQQQIPSNWNQIGSKTRHSVWFYWISSYFGHRSLPHSRNGPSNQSLWKWNKDFTIVNLWTVKNYWYYSNYNSFNHHLCIRQKMLLLVLLQVLPTSSRWIKNFYFQNEIFLFPIYFWISSYLKSYNDN